MRAGETPKDWYLIGAMVLFYVDTSVDEGFRCVLVTLIWMFEAQLN